MSNDYGIGPCMIHDLPLVRAENERKLKALKQAAQAAGDFPEHGYEGLREAFEVMLGEYRIKRAPILIDPNLPQAVQDDIRREFKEDWI